MTSKKVYTYHVSHKFTDKKLGEFNFMSQLYKVGVYGIVNNDPRMQGNFKPSDIVKMEKHIAKRLKNEEITDVQYGREISVQEIDNGWTEVHKVDGKWVAN